MQYEVLNGFFDELQKLIPMQKTAQEGWGAPAAGKGIHEVATTPFHTVGRMAQKGFRTLQSLDKPGWQQARKVPGWQVRGKIPETKETGVPGSIVGWQKAREVPGFQIRGKTPQYAPVGAAMKYSLEKAIPKATTYAREKGLPAQLGRTAAGMLGKRNVAQAEGENWLQKGPPMMRAAQAPILKQMREYQKKHLGIKE